MVIQIIGSFVILAGFALAQCAILNQKSTIYLVINVIGSGLLAADALVERQWGFLVLEGSWALISIVSLCHRKRKSQSPSLNSSPKVTFRNK
jgi:hypothetical protein